MKFSQVSSLEHQSTVKLSEKATKYILSHRNPNVILCDRGIRGFDSYTRTVLGLGAVVALTQLTHLPIIVDPAHTVSA